MRPPYWGVSLLAVLLLLSGCTSVSDREAAEAYYNLGSAYYELGKLNESQRAYKRALELDSSLSGATYNLARIYIEEKRYTDAEKVLVNLLEVDSGNVLIMETLGWLSYRRGDYEAALAWYRRALDSGSGNAAAWYNIGMIHSRLKQHQGAIDALREAVYYDPETLMYPLALARIYNEQQNYLEAVDLLYPRWSGGSRDEQLALVLLKSLVDIEDFPAALDVADKAIEVVEKQSADELDKTVFAELLFFKSFVLLVGFEDTAAGMSILKQSLAAGFDDENGAARFFEYSDIPGIEEIKEVLNEYNLVPEEPPAP